MRRADTLEQILKSGMYLGPNRANIYVTTNPTWRLTNDSTSASPVYRPWRVPFRHYANTGSEIEVPRHVIKSLEINRSLTEVCAQMTMIIRNVAPGGGPNKPGQGYFSIRQGGPQALSRWPGAEVSPWGTFAAGSYGYLGQGSMIRTWQGYGGWHLGRQAAIDAGNVVPTGTWIVDDVNETSAGELTVIARDAGQLLTDQVMYPPFMPSPACYPTQFYSATWNEEVNEDPEGFVPTSTNYDDLLDICELIALWAGFHMPDKSGLMGLREDAGIDSPDIFKADYFDKKHPIDSIQEILKIIGYRVWVNQEGGLHMTSQNIWEAGNRTYDGGHTSFCHEVDELKTLTDLVASWSKRADRSHVVVSQGNPHLMEGVPHATLTTNSSTPGAYGNMLHGMITPAFFALDREVDQKEMTTMAELTGIRMWFARHRNEVKAVANPLIDPDDQVLVWEKTTWENYLNRVISMSTTYDGDAGTYLMSMSTQWMGPDNSGWQIRVLPSGNVVYN